MCPKEQLSISTQPPIIYRMQFIIHISLHHALLHPSPSCDMAHIDRNFSECSSPFYTWLSCSDPQDKVWASSSLEDNEAQIEPCIVLGIPVLLALLTSLHQIIFYSTAVKLQTLDDKFLKDRHKSTFVCPSLSAVLGME